MIKHARLLLILFVFALSAGLLWFADSHGVFLLDDIQFESASPLPQSYETYLATTKTRLNTLKGRKLSEEHKKKIGEANKGNVIGPLGRANMAKARVGRKLSAEHKANIGKAFSGENGPSAKLTESQVLEIREEYAGGGTSLNKLAAKYNVSKKAILNIIQRKTWKHLN
mgnify:CR=1 FL=1